MIAEEPTPGRSATALHTALCDLTRRHGLLSAYVHLLEDAILRLEEERLFEVDDATALRKLMHLRTFILDRRWREAA